MKEDGPKNANGQFYGDVSTFAHHRGFDGVDAVEVGHALAADATEAAEKTEKDIRKDGKGYWGVERASARYAKGGHLYKSGPDIGVASRYTPHAYLPNPPPGFSPKALFTGSHSHATERSQP